MAVFDITAPDGRKFRVTAPDGATQDQVMAYAKQQWDRRSSSRETVENDAISQGARDFAKDMPWTEQFQAGVGKAMNDLLSGTKQFFGGGPSAEEVAETRRLDAPLMKTGGGLTGNIAGNIATLAPLSVIPGANTVGGAAAIAGLTGALQPTQSTGERALNTGLGMALGAGTQYASSGLAQTLADRATRQTIAGQAAQSQNAVRDKTVKEGIESGLVVPPSAVNEPTFLGRRLEAFGGKQATQQDAIIKNSKSVDAMARTDAGLAPNEAISLESLRAARHRMSEPYRQVSALSPQAKADLEALQAAKSESKLQWKAYNRNATVDSFKAAKAADQEAERLLTSIESQAANAGKPELVDALKKARVDIAKNRQVQASLNRGNGSIDPAAIGRAYDNGAPMTGELRKVAAFQQAFPQYMKDPSTVGARASLTELGFGSALGAGGYYAGGPEWGAAMAAVPLLRAPARSLLLSQALQKGLANPNYSGGMLTQAAAKILPPEQAALLARALLPAGVAAGAAANQ